MEQRSPFELAKDIQGLVQSRLRGTDVDSLPPTERELVRALKRQLGDLRLDVRDYGLSETKAEQNVRGKATATGLAELERLLLATGSLGIFGAADMAIISATIDVLRAELKE
ncbi:MAG TPA: hypothetical protein VLE73_06870 [Candidatus Saccharimonadales bacterium]|nr:hypothetical protein [Candidatus Saccharimonadales bacterium]